MQTIATLSNREDAHLLRMRLEAAGVAAFVQEDLDCLMANIGGGVRVQVEDQDVAIALNLLEQDSGVGWAENEVS